MRAITALILLATGCLIVTDDDVAAVFDGDGDTFDAIRFEGIDCNDEDASVYPGAPEIWYDDIDQDCAGDNDFDQDGDGVLALAYGGTDCDDTDEDVRPGVEEVPNDGIDNNCNGRTDETPRPTDGDGDGVTEADGDCNDFNAAIYPGATEIYYDGIDQDCDPSNEFDADGDGFDSDEYGGSDCDDTDDDVHPDAREVLLDGVDNNCDGFFT